MKVAIDGGPNIGKSTVIKLLEQLGFAVVHEQATAVINAGGPLPWIDHEAFQHAVYCRQVVKEENLASASLLFLDRSLYAAKPYRQVQGLPVLDFIQRLPKGLVDVAFILAPVPWDNDGIRYEDPSFTHEIEPYFVRVYEENDVPVVHVPYMSPEARLEFILDHVGKALGRDLTAAARMRGSVITNDRKAERRCFSIPSIGANTCFAPHLALASSF